MIDLEAPIQKDVIPLIINDSSKYFDNQKSSLPKAKQPLSPFQRKMTASADLSHVPIISIHDC
jgi:hypothetical protein